LFATTQGVLLFVTNLIGCCLESCCHDNTELHNVKLTIIYNRENYDIKLSLSKVITIFLQTHWWKMHLGFHRQQVHTPVSCQNHWQHWKNYTNI